MGRSWLIISTAVRCLAGQRHHQFQHIALHHRIQRRRRLIGDQQRRLQQHHRGQHHALAHTAGEFMRPGLDRRLGIAYAHARQHVQHPFAPLGRAQAVTMQLQTFLQLATDGHGRVERSHRLLEHHADARPAQPAQCGGAGARHVHALEQDRTARHLEGRGRQPHDGARRLGLAAAGLADDADHLARRDREGHVADDLRPPAPTVRSAPTPIPVRSLHAPHARIETVPHRVASRLMPSSASAMDSPGRWTGRTPAP